MKEIIKKMFCKETGRELNVIVTYHEDRSELIHISVSLPNRIPNWTEMSFIKEEILGPETVAIQIHPRNSEKVNLHPHCLHIWSSKALTEVVDNIGK